MSEDYLTIVIKQAPYAGERAWNALRLAITALATEVKVRIFLMDDGIYVARKEQKPPSDTPNLEELLKRALSMGAEVRVCGTCVDARGFEPEGEFGVCFIGKKEGGLSMADFIEGVKLGSMMELTGWIMDSEKVISF